MSDHENDELQSGAPAPAAGPDDDPWADDVDGNDREVGGIPRHKAVRIAQIGLVVLALLVVGVVLLTKNSDDDKSDSSSKDKTDQSDSGTSSGKPEWPRTVGGRPPALGKRGQTAPDVTPAKGTKPGAYLWNDYDGWHLWVVTGEGMPAVHGTLTSNDKVAKAVLAVPDAGTVKIDEKVVTFDFPSDQPIVGMDFNPGFYGKSLVFTLDGPDGQIPVNMVFTGSKAVQAPFPLVITKSTT